MKPLTLVHLQQVDSTNEYAKQHGDELPDGAAVLADRQTAGRGRLGRSWQAPAGDSMLCSWLYQRLTPCQLGLLPQASGLAAVRALRQLCGQRAQLKWPNDLVALCGGRYYKLGGILCESRCAGGRMLAVSGIGINLRQSTALFAQAGLPDAASVRSLWGNAPDRMALVEAITEELDRCLAQIARCPAEFLQQYSQSCMTLGKTVTIHSMDGTVRTAVAVRIGEDGSLICRDADGAPEEFAVYAGEVSVRGMGGYV